MLPARSTSASLQRSMISEIYSLHAASTGLLNATFPGWSRTPSSRSACTRAPERSRNALLSRGPRRCLGSCRGTIWRTKAGGSFHNYMNYNQYKTGVLADCSCGPALRALCSMSMTHGHCVIQPLASRPLLMAILQGIDQPSISRYCM